MGILDDLVTAFDTKRTLDEWTEATDFGQAGANAGGEHAVTKSLVFLILLLAAQSAFAKCMPAYHVFSGVAVDGNGKPIPGATVGVSWSDVDGPAGPALAVTDGKGRYNIPVFFDTYSGKGVVVEDECNWRVKFVSASAFKGGLRSPYTKVRVGTAEAVRLAPAVIELKVEVKEDTLLPFLKGPNG